MYFKKSHVLVKNVLDQITQLSISKVSLFIFKTNQVGNGFCDKLGYTAQDELHYRHYALTELQRIDT